MKTIELFPNFLSLNTWKKLTVAITTNTSFIFDMGNNFSFSCDTFKLCRSTDCVWLDFEYLLLCDSLYKHMEEYLCKRIYNMVCDNDNNINICHNIIYM